MEIANGIDDSDEHEGDEDAQIETNLKAAKMRALIERQFDLDKDDGNGSEKVADLQRLLVVDDEEVDDEEVHNEVADDRSCDAESVRDDDEVVRDDDDDVGSFCFFDSTIRPSLVILLLCILRGGDWRWSHNQ